MVPSRNGLHQFLGQPAFLVCCLKPGDPVDGGSEQDPLTELGSSEAEACGEVRYGVAIEAGLVIEVEVLE